MVIAFKFLHSLDDDAIQSEVVFHICLCTKYHTYLPMARFSVHSSTCVCVSHNTSKPGRLVDLLRLAQGIV